MKRLLVALGVLALAWLVAPASPTPPLYDGVGLPDEPYRYLVAPVGDTVQTDPPTAADGHAKVTGSHVGFLYAASGEQGPQIEIQMGEGTVAAPAGAKVVTLHAQPVTPTSQPSDGEIWGNVYRVTASSDKGPVQIQTGGAKITVIALRAPSGPTPEPVVERTDSTGWHRLLTNRIGNDVYSADFTTLGDYTLVNPRQLAGGGGGSSSTNRTAVIVVLALSLLLIAGVVLLVRHQRPQGGLDHDLHADLQGFTDLVRGIAPRLALPDGDRRDLTEQAADLGRLLDEPDPDETRASELVDAMLAGLRQADRGADVQVAILLGGKIRKALKATESR